MIAAVYVFQNGMAMVFDEQGQQLADYQGPWEDVREKVLRDKPPHVAVEIGCVWPRPTKRSL